MTYEERRRSWEKRVEDVLVEITREKTVEGLCFVADVMPTVREFNHLLADVETQRTARKYMISIPEGTNRSE